MTKPLEHTTRSMLIDVHARVPQIEWSMEQLRNQCAVLAEQLQAAIGTNRIAALTVDRLTQENDHLRRMMALTMTYQRMRLGLQP